MSLISKMRKAYAVYWAPSLDDSGKPRNDEFGVPMYSDPIEIRCRWDDVIQLVTTSSGTEVTSNATVYTSIDPSEGGLLYKGRLSVAENENLGRGDVGVHEIVKVSRTPNFKQTETLYTAYL